MPPFSHLFLVGKVLMVAMLRIYLVSAPDPTLRSSGWITSPLPTSRSGDVTLGLKPRLDLPRKLTYHRPSSHIQTHSDTRNYGWITSPLREKWSGKLLNKIDFKLTIRMQVLRDVRIITFQYGYSISLLVS